ncbi:RNA polymerase sigma factor [Candidatus Palauibacter sp.]|uniref:RNA polymerase sigma factor n=1 Tax=Candidatus Palauibacter sp. TaxID=3101350 RepID=UPI003C6F946F
MEERDLIASAKAGERWAMGELYQLHAHRVYTVIRRLVGDDHLAEDLSQEAWIRAFEKLHLFRGDAALGTWLYRLATNVALNRLRRSARRRPVEAAAELPRVSRAQDDVIVTRRVLSQALDQLPPGYRKVLVLHDVEGWTHRDIAESLGCSPGTSKSQLHKARARMRQLIAPAKSGSDGAQDEARL